MEAPFSIAPQNHRDLTSIGGDRRRFEQGFVRSFQDLDRLAILETPQAVAGPLRGQVEQRSSGKPRRERPHGRQGHQLRVPVLRRSIQDRDGPQARTRIGHRRHETSMVGAAGDRQVPLYPVRDAARGAAVGVECPQPRPGAIMILRDVQDGPIGDRCRETHIGIVVGEPFQSFAAGGHPPQIHLPGVLQAARKINPSTVGGPDLVMAVSSDNRIDKNLFGAGAGPIRDEHRVSRGIGVIHDPAAIRGPHHFNRPIDQERPRRSAHHRHDPHAADRCAAEPDFRSVAGEPGVSYRSQSRHVTLASQVQEAARPHLCQPHVERAFAIGEECGEFAVRRESRLGLVACNVRQPGENRVRQRIL